MNFNEENLGMLRSERWNWRDLLLLTFVCLCLVHNTWAFDLEMSVGGGYNDNPRLEKGSEGAAFSQAEINIWQTLSLASYPSTAITFSGFADYQQYDGLDDNWQLGVGFETASKLPGLPCSIELFSEAAAYRNPLVDDNDFDALGLGGRLIWFVNSRLNLEFEAGLNWEDYLQTVASGNNKKIPGQNLNENLNNGQAKDQNILHGADKKNGQPRNHNCGDRSDRLAAAALKVFYAFSPYLDCGSELFWRHRYSSIDTERRSAYGLGVNLNWHPTPTLELFWILSGERVPYKYDFQKKERIEKIYNSEVTASWRRGNWTISGTWNWNNRDSIVNADDYRRNQWQGRLTYSY